jgi:hypothetical protein
LIPRSAALGPVCTIGSVVALIADTIFVFIGKFSGFIAQPIICSPFKARLTRQAAKIIVIGTTLRTRTLLSHDLNFIISARANFDF